MRLLLYYISLCYFYFIFSPRHVDEDHRIAAMLLAIGRGVVMLSAAAAAAASAFVSVY